MICFSNCNLIKIVQNGENYLVRRASAAQYVSLTPERYPKPNENIVKIDIDCLDTAETKVLLPFVPFDQTSNQRLVYVQMVDPENRDLFLRTVKERKDDGWQSILDCMVSTFNQAKAIFYFLR